MTQADNKPFEELPDAYKIYFREETREKLKRGEVVHIELDQYLSVNIMNAEVEVFTIPELLRKLKALEAYDDGSLDDLDWPGVDSKQDSDVEST